MSSINSIYSLTGMSINYVCAQQAYKHMLKAKKEVHKRKTKAGVVHHQWPIGRASTYKPHTRTMLAVRGAYVEGQYVGDVYIKEGNM